MANYKVPQDVEADDKLIGPFSFRQFVYLLIAGGLIALAVGLFQIFPILAIIPVPFVLFFGALALPLKKDQPMETYLAAVISFYLKPRNRIWKPGQKESAITITAPKIVEDTRTRNITGEEATHRLSFLADIVDTGGYAIKGAGMNPMREDLIAEANSINDMFETTHFSNLENTITRHENERHEEALKEMRDAIAKNNSFSEISGTSTTIQKHFSSEPAKEETKPKENVVVSPNVPDKKPPVEEKKEEKVENIQPKPSIMELAKNDDYSVATIAKEANRINEKEGEVFISLH